MIDEKKKPSWFIRLRPKNSSCCNVIIEEVDDEGEEAPSSANSTITGAGVEASRQGEKK